MKHSVTITILSNTIPSEDELKRLAIKELSKNRVFIKPKDISSFVFIKKSLDCRHKTIKTHLRYDVYTDGEKPESFMTGGVFVAPWKMADPKKTVVIVGSGPAGLFAALQLLESGIKPIIIERGTGTSSRKKDIAQISVSNTVNADSNYCFGEGGAGTFSDGKLYTRSNKRGNIQKILAIFNHHGATDSILTDAHPHIGTDKLPSVINNICATIIKFGGEVRFNTKLVDFELSNNTIKSVLTQDTLTNQTCSIPCECVILSTGHSATDVYTLLAKININSLEAKTFAIGVRVEHDRKLIDSIQYHGQELHQALPAAEYRLVTQVENRGVYSFCMCPGGLVVPSASKNNEIVVNGMSPSSRNGKWSNSAIVVEIRPEDCVQILKDLNIELENEVTAGLELRTLIEHRAFELTKTQAAPAVRLADFLEDTLSKTLPETSYVPGLVATDLTKVLPRFITERLKTAFYEFNKQMQGFITNNAVLIAPETRTSTPVRIVRNKDTCESPVINGLFPAGEGSGYSGGIVSSAMDGELVAKAVINTFNCKTL